MPDHDRSGTKKARPTQPEPQAGPEALAPDGERQRGGREGCQGDQVVAGEREHERQPAGGREQGPPGTASSVPAGRRLGVRSWERAAPGPTTPAGTHCLPGTCRRACRRCQPPAGSDGVHRRATGVGPDPASHPGPSRRAARRSLPRTCCGVPVQVGAGGGTDADPPRAGRPVAGGDRRDRCLMVRTTRALRRMPGRVLRSRAGSLGPAGTGTAHGAPRPVLAGGPHDAIRRSTLGAPGWNCSDCRNGCASVSALR